MSADNVEQTLTEDQVLAYTQNKRKTIVDVLMENNRIPADRGEMALLVQALDGLDRAALGSKRIKADEKASEVTAGSAAAIARLLTELGSRNKHSVDDITDAVPREAPVLGNHIPDPVLVPGEIDVAGPQLDYESFTASFQSKSNSENESF